MAKKYLFPFVNLDEVKDYIEEPELDENTGTSITNILIPAMSAIIEGWCGRNFYKRDYDERMDGSGRRILQLPNFPLVSGESFTISDRRSSSTYENGEYTFDYTLDTDYVLDLDTAQVKKTSGVWSKTFLYYRVQYTAGFDFDADNPDREVMTLKQACLKWIAIDYEKVKGHVHSANQSVRGDEIITFHNDKIPKTVQGMIEYLRRLR